MTVGQTSLLGGEPVPEVKLGPRQELVLSALREQGGLSDDEAGALVHAARGTHRSDERCVWCPRVGKTVLASLRAHGLAVRRRSGTWEPKGVRRAESAQDDEGALFDA
jgi:hypothetical protein